MAGLPAILSVPVCPSPRGACSATSLTYYCNFYLQHVTPRRCDVLDVLERAYAGCVLVVVYADSGSIRAFYRPYCSGQFSRARAPHYQINMPCLQPAVYRFITYYFLTTIPTHGCGHWYNYYPFPPLARCLRTCCAFPPPYCIYFALPPTRVPHGLDDAARTLSLLY